MPPLAFACRRAALCRCAFQQDVCPVSRYKLSYLQRVSGPVLPAVWYVVCRRPAHTAPHWLLCCRRPSGRLRLIARPWSCKLIWESAPAGLISLQGEPSLVRGREPGHAEPCRAAPGRVVPCRTGCDGCVVIGPRFIRGRNCSVCRIIGYFSANLRRNKWLSILFLGPKMTKSGIIFLL